MRFRPCIDIHNGKVKQIVGSSLQDSGDHADSNYISDKEAAYYAALYKAHQLSGGHIIMLNAAASAYHEATKQQALQALQAYPQGMQIGGGITADNAQEYLDAGASHVIVTSYIFREGRIDYERLRDMAERIGKEHLVLDLSCRKREDAYSIMTDRWQVFTDTVVTHELLYELSGYCSEFLIHAVDVEGKTHGIETELVQFLAQQEHIPITYAGGISSLADLELLKRAGRNRLDVTIGSALDLFGGSLKFNDIIAKIF
ncbi:MAG: phosphoribosylformimino-5-aminoimidazole carboxamide ribotide isomerase [Lachnospiraceae bacterium]